VKKGDRVVDIRFDHFITYTSAHDIDDYLKEYAAQGFVPAEETVRHHPGLRNGFVFIGPEYLEFCWVEDEALFAEADEQDRLRREALHPFGLGMVSGDVQAVHEDWTRQGYKVPEVYSSAPRDAPAEAPPKWSFQTIPEELLPGIWCFALTYHSRPKDKVTQVRPAPNTIYAVSGMTFVSTDPEARANSWRDLLAPDEEVVRSGTGWDVQIGAHRATWMTPDDYQVAHGFNWMPSPHSNGELAALQLLASDLAAVQNTMAQAGRRTSPVNVGAEDALLIEPDVRDGFTFFVRQQPIENWLQERKRRTGERLQLAEDRVRH
jgi:hypothetical protein